MGKIISKTRHKSDNVSNSTQNDQLIQMFQKSKSKYDKIVYTCITGGYDDVPQHKYIAPDWDYILFTDNADLIRAGHIYHWTVRPLMFDKMDNVRNNRWHKINAHILFPNYEYSLYLDGNIIINDKKVFDNLKQFIANGIKIAIPLHPKRDCIYAEAEEIKKHHIDYTKIVNAQIRYLKREKYPAHYGLFENCILLRRHNDIVPVLESWWTMVCKYSKRDQLSGPYVIWKYGIEVAPLYNVRGYHRNCDEITFVYAPTHDQDKIKQQNVSRDHHSLWWRIKHMKF